ncbi:MAG: hypothetical protein R3199_09400, partial [Gemmatimonadota bacterium]|nr:hypothetical protein [Gemmatimonadota bacterium]
GFGEEECWSYAEIENDPRFHYETMEFGRGEGLAVDDGTIYVILDNNLDQRTIRPGDRRPLLFVMERLTGPRR